MTDLEAHGPKRKAADDSEVSAVEKKEKSSAVYPPSVFGRSKLRIAITSNIPVRYKVPSPAELEWAECMNPRGPDSLTIRPKDRDSKSKPVWLTIHRKADEDETHRVVFARKGAESVEMTGVTNGSMFVIKGPGGFEIRVVAEPKPDKLVTPDVQSQLEATIKERQLMAKVILIRREYEETVLPKLPISLQSTGSIIMGSLLPSATVQLRRDQLAEVEKQLLNE